jgi:hypothetical protein
MISLFSAWKPMRRPVAAISRRPSSIIPSSGAGMFPIVSPRKHLKPTTPASAIGRSCGTLSCTSRPMIPKSTYDFSSASRRFSSTFSTVSVLGLVLGISTTVVTPP